MSYTPSLRVRREKPHLVANLLAIAIIATWALVFVLWEPMTTERPSVVVPSRVRLCEDPTQVSDPNC